jgi:APA family basic amino acid/polyamine antiporter
LGHVLCSISPANTPSSLLCTLACNGLVLPWFGIVDGTGNMRNGTLFAGVLMMLITLFVQLQYLNNFISARILVAFSMTNLPLVLLWYKSPDNNLNLLERHLAFLNAISFLCMSTISYALTCLCCLVALCTCVRIKRQCPVVTYFGGKMRRSTIQHMIIRVMLVEEEYFRMLLVPYLLLLDITINWYLVAQLPWSNLVFLILFLSLAVGFYYLFDYHFSKGNNGGWNAYNSCALSIHKKPSAGGGQLRQQW